MLDSKSIVAQRSNSTSLPPGFGLFFFSNIFQFYPSTFTPIFFIKISFALLPMGCGAAESTCLGFVCFVVINPRLLSTNRVDLGFFVSYIFKFYSPPPPQVETDNLTSDAKPVGIRLAPIAQSAIEKNRLVSSSASGWGKFR